MSKFNVGDLVQQLVHIHVSPIGMVVSVSSPHSQSLVVEVLWINGDRRNEWTENLRKIITPCQRGNKTQPKK